MSKNTTFRHVVLCHTHDFPPKQNDKIKGWVEKHGGTFMKSLTPDVTHFISSKSSWKKYIPIVRAARRQKNTKVVSLDWLEDSLLSLTRRPKDTKPYEWDRISAKKKLKDDKQAVEKDKQIEKALIQHEIAVTEFEKETGHTGYHIYTDDTHFAYSITLVRADILSNRSQFHKLKVRFTSHISRTASAGTSFNANTNLCPIPLYLFPRSQPLSRYPVVKVCLPSHLRQSHPRCRVPVANPWAQTLQLYESDAIPHRYMTLTRYTKPEKTATAELSPIGSRYDVAVEAFKKFFKLKTNAEWEARSEKRARCCDTSSKGNGGCDDHFQYKPPGLEKPKGARKRSALVKDWERKDNQSRGSSVEVTVLLPSM